MRLGVQCVATNPAEIDALPPVSEPPLQARPPPLGIAALTRGRFRKSLCAFALANGAICPGLKTDPSRFRVKRIINQHRAA